MKRQSRSILIGLLVFAAVPAAISMQAPTRSAPSTTDAGNKQDWKSSLGLHAQVKETCFLKGEKTDGMNKICFYNCTSGEAAITIKSTSLCPLNIQR